MNVKANTQRVSHSIDAFDGLDLGRIVEEASIGMIVVDLDGRGIYANAAFCKLFGYDADECIGLGLHDVIHPDQAVDLDSALMRLRSGEIDKYQVERKYIRKDGSTLWGMGYVTVLRDRKTGKPECHVVQVIDVGAKKDAEAELATKEQYLSLAVEIGELNAWDWNPITNQVWNYPNRETMLGYTVEEVGEGLQDWMALLHPDDREEANDLAERIRRGDIEDYRTILRWRHKNGSWRWLQSRGKVARRTADGLPMHVVGITTDITSLKRAEIQLSLANQRLKLATDAGRIGVFDAVLPRGDDPGYTLATPKVFEIFGLEPLACKANEDVGHDARLDEDWALFQHADKRWLAGVHPDDYEQMYASWRESITTGCSRNTEYRIVQPNGEVRHVHELADVFLDREGNPSRYIGILIDITEKRRTETSLALATERLRQATEAGRIGIFDEELPSAYVVATPKVFDIFGLEPLAEIEEDRVRHPAGIPQGWALFQRSESEGRWLGSVHPDDVAAAYAAYQDAIEKKNSSSIEYRIIRPDGEIRHVHEIANVLRDDEGNPSRYIGVLIDNTEQKTSDAKLAAASERLQLAVAAGGVGIFDFDFVTRFCTWSDRMHELYGCEPGSYDGTMKSWVRHIHPDDYDRVVREMELATERTSNFNEDYRIVDRNSGAIRHVRTLARVIRDADGTPLRAVGVQWDITDQKEVEASLAATTERLQLSAEAGGVGIYEATFDKDAPTGRWRWSDRIYEISGLEPGTFDGTEDTWTDLIHPDDRALARRTVQDMLHRTFVYQADYRMLNVRTGTYRHVRSLGRLFRDTDGTPLRTVGVLLDITDHKHMEAELHEEKERLRITLESIGDAVISTDPQGVVTFMNPIAETMTGWNYADALGRPASEIFITIDDANGQALPDPVSECLRLMQPRYQQGDAVLLARDGNCIDVQSSAAPVKTAGDEVIGAVLVFKDASQARALRRTLEHHANHDSLTALPNRRAFEQELREAIAEAEEQARRHVVCFLDLDRFKIVNDSAGHTAGDALLREISDLLRYRTRSHDLVARLGGDEFAILLRDCSVAEGESIARQLVDAIMALRFRWDGRRYEIGASVGLTAVRGDILAPDDLVSQADAACYVAKSKGNSHVVVYEEEPHGQAQRYRRDIKVAANIRDAIDTGRFCLYAQEIRSLQPDRPIARSYEILLRMRDDKGRIVSPSDFIPAAERFALMDRLDRWVIRNVLHGEGSRLRAADDVTIAINLSANSLDDPTLWAYLKAELEASQLPPQRLHLEITETALIENVSSAVAFIEQARAAGCGITLDDFGTGLSSFAYLRQFPVDTIKIDGSFIRQLASNPVDRAITESINTVARRLGARTIAEQVEDEATLELVREIGIDQAQGYAIGRPLPLLAVV